MADASWFLASLVSRHNALARKNYVSALRLGTGLVLGILLPLRRFFEVKHPGGLSVQNRLNTLGNLLSLMANGLFGPG